MDDNKRNLVYFEAPSMRELYSQMDAWQADKRKRLQSVSVHRDGDLFCCIGMTNPSEVLIVDKLGNAARVDMDGRLNVWNWGR